MRPACIKRFDGGEDVIETYNIHDFPYDKLNTKALICKHKKKPKYIVYTFATFDIETTTIDNGNDTPYGFMYHWQMDVGGYIVTGRRWEEWVKFMLKLVEIFKTDETRHFVVYIHNEAFEFQFIRDFLNEYMGGFTVFAAERRKPIYVTTGNGIQFRCSYKLTNMSLEKAVQNELGVVHCKAAGDLDYRVIRTADTPLDDTEFGYCVSDVVSLYELIERRLINEHDNLESIPMTSTGYVRRDCRNACRKDEDYREEFLKQEMTESVYKLLMEAGRGGNTHANRYMSGRVWHEVDSFDVASSYPSQMFLREFPVSKFTPYGEIENMTELESLLSEYACLFRVIFTGLEVRDNIGMPYIPISKATAHSKHITLDNGRVLSTVQRKMKERRKRRKRRIKRCHIPLRLTNIDDEIMKERIKRIKRIKRGYISLTLTDIDYQIIKEQYTWDDMSISDFHIATYGYLPEALLSQVMAYFKAKTELKDKIKEAEKRVDEEEAANLAYLYAKSKNRLNGIFGMCYTNPVHNIISINEDGKWIEDAPEIADALKKYWKSRNSFLVYAWGVWITAWARRHLEDLFNALGQDKVIYGDTDSGKAVDVDISKIDALNAKVMALADKRGAYCDYNGTRYYMGVYEHENKIPIAKFKTLGAKKYVYEDEKGLHVTISGVNKKLGAKEIGSIDNFVPGFIFKEAGGLTLYYNDAEQGIHQITVDGCTMTTASNIGMIDSTYEIGITSEYAELIGYNIYYDIDKSDNNL